MVSGNYRGFLFSTLVVIFANFVFGGTTGKITGRALEKNTGIPLIGVNIIVKGTTLGSITDNEGYYVILNVEPGAHTVTASMIGYSAVSVNAVRVFIDQTATVNVEMISEDVTLGDVVIVAERSLLKKDVATSVVSIATEEISALPVSSINDVMGLQAGIEDGLVIRGGGADEMLFQVDGVTMRDPRNNQPISSIALSSIQEVSIERGGFNAEYGQVRSGLANIVTKEGNVSQYSGSITIKYSPATPKHFGMSVYDPNSMWNRPYLDPSVAWIGTKGEPFEDVGPDGTVFSSTNPKDIGEGDGVWQLGEPFTDYDHNRTYTPSPWDEYTRRQYPDFNGWYAVSEGLLKDSDPTNDLSPIGAQKVWMWERRRRPNTTAPDYNIDGGFGGPVPFISKAMGDLRFFTSFRLQKEMLLIPLSRDDYKEYNWSIKVNSNITNSMKLMASGSTGKSYNVAINENDKQFNNPSWGINGVAYWNPTDFMRSPYQIAEITNEQRPSRIFTDSWYSTSEVSHFTASAKISDFIGMSTHYDVSIEHVNRDYLTGPIRQRDLTKRYEIVPGYFVDEAPFGWDATPNSGLTGMFFGGHSSTSRDSSKLGSYLLKANLESQVNQENLIKTGVEFSYYDLNLNYGLINPFFGDLNYVKQLWQPYRFSMYIQDKIEAYGFIASVGLRMDLSNPNTEWVVVDPFDRSYFSTGFDETSAFPKQKTKLDIAFSPRLAISHPITEYSKLYFNYGHFKEMPGYAEVFRIGRGTAGNMRNYGDPNLTQSKTISYELGFDQVLLESYLIQLAAFYNDITGQQAYTNYVSDRKGINYFSANNNSYEDIRGFEVTFKKTEGLWIRGFINYTYQISTQGVFGKPVIDENPGQQKINDQTTRNLYQQKPVPQPRANASITFLTPKDIEPALFAVRPLGNWNINLLAQWRAGEFVTYNPRQIPEIVNNVQVTDVYNVDLRFMKTFDFDKIDVGLFIEVRNLLNTKRLSGASFYDGHDQRYYLESLHLPESRGYDNIPGDDRIGEYRKVDKYQPIENRGTIMPGDPGSVGVIYWERLTGKYKEKVNGQWIEVESGRMKKILDDKAYIDMPNNSSFDFLNPRQLFFGVNLSFTL